jgi:hypothetical protein
MLDILAVLADGGWGAYTKSSYGATRNESVFPSVLILQYNWRHTLQTVPSLANANNESLPSIVR